MQERKIYSTQCWLNQQLQPATICFQDGIITAIHFEKLDDAEDMGSHIIMPGVIDVHVHINEPGRTDWEGFDTATQAAAAGGSTTIVDMPLNASPVTTTLAAFHQKLDASKNKLNVNVGFYAGLIPGNAQHLKELINAGILGVKCFLTHSGIDEFPNVTEADLDEAMPIIAKHNIPLLAHCELSADIANDLNQLQHGQETSYQHYLASRPKKWENEAVEMMIKMCRKHQCQVHIVHVSSAEALALIAAAKHEGLPITAETCTQYIYFNAEDIPDANCLYKCAPPIREKANNDLLKQALANGVLNFISTDHSPAPPSIKEIETGNLMKAWGGIAGIQYLLSASWTALKDMMPVEQFIPLVTSHPAAFIKANKKGVIEVGNDADFVIWNPNESFTVKEEDILFKHKISTYTTQMLDGIVLETIVNGECVYQNNIIINKNKGQWLLRK